MNCRLIFYPLLALLALIGFLPAESPHLFRCSEEAEPTTPPPLTDCEPEQIKPDDSSHLYGPPTLEEAIPLAPYLLPEDHPAHSVLQNFLIDSTTFDSFDSIREPGFILRNPSDSLRDWSVMVISHPQLEGYLIKKYRNAQHSRTAQLWNYLLRIVGARRIAKYIATHNCQHLVVPQKWLYRIAQTSSHEEGNDYCLVVEKLDICPGGYWGGETKERYAKMDAGTMEELCFLLFQLGGCDAWPQNIPYTTTGQLAFIDTEHVGRTFRDFIRLIPYINPSLRKKAIELWHSLDPTWEPPTVPSPSTIERSPTPLPPLQPVKENTKNPTPHQHTPRTYPRAQVPTAHGHSHPHGHSGGRPTDRMGRGRFLQITL